MSYEKSKCWQKRQAKVVNRSFELITGSSPSLLGVSYKGDDCLLEKKYFATVPQ